MMLNYRQMGDGPAMIIMHGLFGSSDNWQSLAKLLAAENLVILPDLRNHGHSPQTDEFSYALMAEDIAGLIAHEQLRDVMLVGHSMGGKVAIEFALKYPWLLRKLVVIDIGTKQYPEHHQAILEALNSADLNVLQSRNEVQEHLERFISDAGVLQFLMKNLYWADRGRLGWRINIPVLTREMPEILRKMDDTRIDVETVFVRGGLSRYVLDEDIPGLKKQFSLSTIITVEGAGHWVHAENPAAVVEILQKEARE
jgi:pimeloyl-ACP methyl ester carboxylesterase